MPRTGRKPINIPVGVEMKINGNVVTVKGAKGTLTQQFCSNMVTSQRGSKLTVTRPNGEKENRALHGLTRTLTYNMTVGMTEGFKRELDVLGVDYHVQKQDKDPVMNLGYSRQVIMSETDEIQIKAPTLNKVIIYRIDRQKVGRFIVEVRGKRPSEPYKSKGVRYAGEFARRKEGKVGKGSRK